jgi:methionine-rich copper-binding protein CopC
MGALIVAVVGGLLLLRPAYAHSEYQRSEPGEGAVVARSPQRVNIWFTQELFRRQGENQIQVFGETGQSVQAGDAQVDDDDRKHLWVSLQADLQPGRYRVVWRSLSAEDGDVDEGEFSHPGSCGSDQHPDGGRDANHYCGCRRLCLPWMTRQP